MVRATRLGDCVLLGVRLAILLVDVSTLINLNGVCEVVLLIYNNFVVVMAAAILVALGASRMGADVGSVFKDIAYKLRFGVTLIHQRCWV